MAGHKILFINLGYARGIDGRLSEHIRYAHRHVYCSPLVQKKSLQQLGALIAAESPDICCMVEIDRGAFGSAAFNQLDDIRTEHYAFFDIENKYARDSILRSFALTAGKSNAFIARKDYPFEKLFFTRGVKRLIYKIQVDKNTTLLFAHFALKKTVRTQQIMEARNLMRQCEGEVIFMGDFNILDGLQEIEPLLDGGRFALLNRVDLPTFFFHKRKKVIDLCVCSAGIGKRAALRILPQPYTDHAALVLEISP